MASTPPNVEADVIAVMRDDGGVQAVVSQRVYGERPPKAVDPMIVVQRLGGPVVANWLEGARIQIDGWGNTRSEAFAAVSAAVAALRPVSGALDHGVVSGCTQTIAPLWLPDPVTTRPRYITEFMVHAHPLSAP